MNAFLAIIDDGGRAIFVINREAVEINYFPLYFIDSTKTHLTMALANPFRRGSWGWGMFVNQNHATEEGNGSSWWGCL
jgi:hypothetical protein